MSDEKSPKNDPSAIILPFGKHKGKTVSELLATDQSYADWILGQGWVAERFAELHAAILTRGAMPDDTPEHNALQARFLEEDFRHATLLAAVPDFLTNVARYRAEDLRWRMDRWEYRNDREKLLAELEIIGPGQYLLKSDVQFEQRGVDVVVKWWNRHRNPRFSEVIDGETEKLELKPTIGDDYPAVMREMKRLGSDILVVGRYTGRGVSEIQMRKMFGVNKVRVVFVQEIEDVLVVQQ